MCMQATLSIGDIMHTWHWGVKYNVTVISVMPSMYPAITVINTDLEVNFAPPPEEEGTLKNAAATLASSVLKPSESGQMLGYMLGLSMTTTTMTSLLVLPGAT